MHPADGREYAGIAEPTCGPPQWTFHQVIAATGRYGCPISFLVVAGAGEGGVGVASGPFRFCGHGGSPAGWEQS